MIATGNKKTDTGLLARPFFHPTDLPSLGLYRADIRVPSQSIFPATLQNCSPTNSLTIYDRSQRCPQLKPLTMATSSSRTPYPDPRPVPRKLDSTASSSQTQSSSTSPRSPLSPYTPSSPTSPSSRSGEGTSYFTREPMSLDQAILQRLRPRSPSPNTSPLPSPTSMPGHAYSRSASDPSSPTSPTRPGHVKRKSRGSGTVTQCGRHGNEWLFGNISVTDTVKGLFHKEERRN